MKIINKFSLIVTILSIILCFSACSGKNTEKAEEAVVVSSEDVEVESNSSEEVIDGNEELQPDGAQFSYTIMTKDIQEDGIVGQYPQLVDSSNQEKEDEINKIIIDDIMGLIEAKKSEAEKPSDLLLNISYGISGLPNKVLSISYLGNSYVEGSAYVQNFYHSLNISLGEIYRVPLNELFEVEDFFVKQFKSGLYSPYSDGLNLEDAGTSLYDLISAEYDSEALSNLFNNEDVDYILKEQGVLLSIEVPHALGDHLEMAIPYEAIESNMSYAHPIWENYLFIGSAGTIDSSNAGFTWDVYRNDKYGYSLSYPLIYDQYFESDNVDGIMMNSTDGMYTLTIWAMNNLDGSGGNRLLEEAKSRVSYISEEYSDDDSYNLVYEGGGDDTTIQFVESGYVNGEHAVFYIISYPMDELYEFTDIIARMDSELYID
ncbi:MAG: hypothetical protein K0S47_4118 [Herbinix sp.]|jgi:hypothetical protein|nr:hypothetical protein [Herbinix sp.]